jgi:hypothetical protein
LDCKKGGTTRESVSKRSYTHFRDAVRVSFRRWQELHFDNGKKVRALGTLQPLENGAFGCQDQELVAYAENLDFRHSKASIWNTIAWAFKDGARADSLVKDLADFVTQLRALTDGLDRVSGRPLFDLPLFVDEELWRPGATPSNLLRPHMAEESGRIFDRGLSCVYHPGYIDPIVE